MIFVVHDTVVDLGALGKAMNNGQSAGVAALVMAALAFFVPVVGIFLAWLSFLFAILAAERGDRVLCWAAFLVSVLNLVFFTPSLWAMSLFSSTAWMAQFTLLMLVLTPIALSLTVWRFGRGGDIKLSK